MNLGLMTVNHNYPKIFMDDREEFPQHSIKVPPELVLHNCIKDKTLMCSLTSQFSLT